MGTVRKIEKTEIERIMERNRTRRVAIYARVSTTKKAQLHSMSQQVSALTQWVHSQTWWELVDIYLDFDSASGMKMRSQFERMIDDAKNHRIDLIVTKSVQRFGRSTVENLEAMRTLIRSGVVVYFQVENTYTDQADAELIVSLASGIAEEDNKSRRNDRMWGVQKRVEDGTSELYRRPCYGYVKQEDGVLTIDREKAQVVRDIFQAYLDGKSIGGIKRMLEERHIPSPTGGEKWPARTIDMLLSNEKYTGEIILYKTVMVGYPNSRRVMNRDSAYKDRYCITNGVEAIIDEETFNRVQEEKKRRSPFEEGPDGKRRRTTKYSSKIRNGITTISAETEE